MLGRQRLLPDASALQEVFAIHGINLRATEFLHANKYGEEFFSLLGAHEINSMDYSSYEGATILQDEINFQHEQTKDAGAQVEYGPNRAAHHTKHSLLPARAGP